MTAFAHAKRRQIRSGDLHENWNKIRRPEKFQRDKALELTRLAKVVSSQFGCDLEEVHRFQLYFAEKRTAIIVHAFSSFGSSADPLYDGLRLVMETQSQIDYILRIIFYESLRHFQPF